jgi:KaiC/GvpD/RAD55 family RecA-like ATPase
LSDTITLTVLNELFPEGIEYGTNLLIEFQPDSVWYESSLTIAANALSQRVRTEYHTFEHIPNEIRKALARLGSDVKELEGEGLLRVLDSYTAQTGLGASEAPEGSPYQSMKLSDWSITAARSIRSQADKRRLHIDDNVSVLSRYNSENSIVDFWRTRVIPLSRANESIFLNSITLGVHPEAFYRQFESLCDGIIEFRSQEEGGRIQQLVRLKVLRGKACDSRWHQLQILENRVVPVS